MKIAEAGEQRETYEAVFSARRMRSLGDPWDSVLLGKYHWEHFGRSDGPLRCGSVTGDGHGNEHPDWNR